jgi:hypothetical protein
VGLSHIYGVQSTGLVAPWSATPVASGRPGGTQHPHGAIGFAAARAEGSSRTCPHGRRSSRRFVWLRTRCAFLLDDVDAELDTLVADADAGSGNQLVDLVLRLPAERAPARPIHPFRSSTTAPSHDRIIGRGLSRRARPLTTADGLRVTSRPSADRTKLQRARAAVSAPNISAPQEPIDQQQSSS